MAEPKTYVPKSSAKEMSFQNGGSIIKLSFNAEALVQFIKEHTNERGYVNLTVGKRREVGQRGDTHYIALDTWQPRQGGGGAPAPQRQSAPPAPATQPPEEEIPF